MNYRILSSALSMPLFEMLAFTAFIALLVGAS